MKSLALRFAWKKSSLKKLSDALNVCKRGGKRYTESMPDASKKLKSEGGYTILGHQPGFLPAWLAEEGVSAVIASGMGSRARALFNENRIEVVVGVLGDDPEKAVLDYIKGELATGDNICDH
jgi:hypothetical protein